MKVINLTRVRAWRDLKKFIDSGRVLLPPTVDLRPREPVSDFGLAFAYMLEGIRKEDSQWPRG